LWLGDVGWLLDFRKNRERRLLRSARLPPDRNHKNGRSGADRLYSARKNWSSLMLFNCEHPSVRKLTPEVVNKETALNLHRLQWIRDRDIAPFPKNGIGSRDGPNRGRPLPRKPCSFTAEALGSNSGRKVDYGRFVGLAEYAALKDARSTNPAYTHFKRRDAGVLA